jgi:isoleucyl-tRNA synthetase
MSFTCEEVWQYLPALPERLSSVHLANFPGASDILGGAVAVEDAAQAEDWKVLLAVRTEVLKALEEARQSKLIGGANLEAHVTVTAAEPIFSVLSRYKDQLRFLFIVSAVMLEQSASGNGTGRVNVRVSKAEGKKCERCWNYSIHVGEDPNYPTVCERCSKVLKELGG